MMICVFSYSCISPSKKKQMTLAIRADHLALTLPVRDKNLCTFSTELDTHRMATSNNTHDTAPIRK